MDEIQTPEKLTYERAAELPIGTIAKDFGGYWEALGRRYLKTSDNTWALFFDEPSSEQIAEAIEHRINNVSPAPLGVSVTLQFPEIFPGTRDMLRGLSIRH